MKANICGPYVVIMWSVCGQYVVSMWSVCDQYVASMWLVCGQYVVSMWSVCGPYVVRMWSVNSCVLICSVLQCTYMLHDMCVLRIACGVVFRVTVCCVLRYIVLRVCCVFGRVGRVCGFILYLLVNM